MNELTIIAIWGMELFAVMGFAIYKLMKMENKLRSHKKESSPDHSVT